MYKHSKPTKTSIKQNKSYEGERIEEKINRIVNNKEPIKDGAPIIFTDRADGVLPEYNIKTDRFEVALDAMDAVARAQKAKRDHRINERPENKEKARLAKEALEGMKKEGIGGPEPLQGTAGDPK